MTRDRRDRLDYEPDEMEIAKAMIDVYGDLRGVEENTGKKRPNLSNHERKGAKGKKSPVSDYIRSLGDYYSTKEVAEKLGRSEGWVRKAANRRWTQAPSYVAPFGDTHVNLYTPEDIQALREYIESNHTVYKRDEYPHEEK